jgi:hypothetical protein
MGRLLATCAAAAAMAVAPQGAASAESLPNHSAALAALQYFASVPDADFDALMSRLRGAPLPPEVRALVIANLPREGELTPTLEETALLDTIAPVLRFHRREQEMVVRLATVGGLAFVGLHARTVLVISREALTLLDGQELMAVMAHEIGHDYVWDAYERARRRHDTRTMQELDLRCDGLAVITMARLGIPAERLVSGLSKLYRYNTLAFPVNDARYAPLTQRITFIRVLARTVATAAHERSAARVAVKEQTSGWWDSYSPGSADGLDAHGRSWTPVGRCGLVEPAGGC